MLYRVISLVPSSRGYNKIVLGDDLSLADAQDLVDQNVFANTSDLLVIEEQ